MTTDTQTRSFEIATTTVRYFSGLSPSDAKTSLKSEAVNGKTTQIIAPKYSADGRGHMIIWIDDEA